MAHGHGHDHDHDHHHHGEAEIGHAHVHGHAQNPEGHREALSRKAGAGKILFLDAFSGVAGDMTVAALVDLGVPFSVVEEAVNGLGVGAKLGIESAMAGAIGATRFQVHIEPQGKERSWNEIDHMLAHSKLEPEVSALARKIFFRLAKAESEVHRVAVERVHFHEVGAVDAIADIVGAAAAFSWLGAEVISSPLPLGRGHVECRHGIIPLPAPATVGCLRGVPTLDSGIDEELVTPTGAAIVATVASSFVRWPSFSPERIGWGAGTKKLPDRPNALRVVLGVAEKETDEKAHGHVLLECNVDDLTGELAAHAIRTLLASGARDAWATPVTMKKGRPGLTLSAIAESGSEDRIAEVMLRETSTIGIRRLPFDRVERPRRMVEVVTRFGPIPIKVSEGPYGPPQLKPEFDACVAAAEAHGVPVKEVIFEALEQGRKIK